VDAKKVSPNTLMMLNQRYSEDINYGIEWIDEAISKEHIKHYEYKNFNNIQEIGSGGYGIVYRADWKNSKKCFALKSFELNGATANEVVREVKKKYIYIFYSLVYLFLISY
jgi:serine/threonine protein kinase